MGSGIGEFTSSLCHGIGRLGSGEREHGMNNATENHPDFSRYDDHVFTEENLLDSRDFFKTIRDLGDAVWVPTIDAFIVARYHDVVMALRAPDKLISSKGVSLNQFLNSQAASGPGISTLLTDGVEHKHLKKISSRPLTPAGIASLRYKVANLADERVKALVNGKSFEAVEVLASFLPLTIIADMVGIKNVDNEKLITWSSAAQDAFAPFEYVRSDTAGAVVGAFFEYIQSIERKDLVQGGWADQLFAASDAGEITLEQARGLMSDYIVPSLDTTIYSIGEMLHGLATTPGAWEKLKTNPDLISSVIDESVRLATPLRGFARFVAEDFELSESTLPAGTYVWLLYGAANRDERKYPDPDAFDVERNPRDHLGWGHGVHLCLGKHLARLEMESILRALLKHVDRIEAEPPSRVLNNIAQGFKEMNMRFTATGRS